MWRPGYVVEGHRKRAKVVWMLLLALILGYAIYIVLKAYRARESPSISVQLEADRYTFPTLTMCTTPGRGCYDDDGTICAATVVANPFEANGFDVGSVENGVYIDLATVNKESYACVDIWLRNLTETAADGLFPPYVSLMIAWDTGAEDEEEVRTGTMIESVLMFMTDPGLDNPLDSKNQSVYIGAVPYSPFETGGNATVKYSNMMMEMTESVDLNGKSEKYYSVASIITTNVVNFPTLGVIGYTVLVLDINQPKFSHTLRREIDPVSWSELVGTVGGTWEFILLLWGLMFISTQREPNLKGRNIKKSAQKGVKAVHSAASEVLSLGGHSVLRRSSVTSEGEAAPTWDAGRDVESGNPPPAYNSAADNSQPPEPVEWGVRIGGHGDRQPTGQSQSGSGRLARQMSPGQHDSAGHGLELASRRAPVVPTIPRPASRPS